VKAASHAHGNISCDKYKTCLVLSQLQVGSQDKPLREVLLEETSKFALLLQIPFQRLHFSPKLLIQFLQNFGI